MNAGEGIPPREIVTAFAELGVTAFTTTRADADYALAEPDASPAALAHWQALLASFGAAVPRLASARQVHGTRVIEHGGDWHGWVRHEGADGHLAFAPGTAMAVTVADCVPVFLATADGVAGILHAGWRGTAGRIVTKALDQLAARGIDAARVHVHLGPGICGRCYEVGPDVFEQLTGWTTIRNRHVDLRALLSEQAKEYGVARVTSSPHCSRCDNDRFYSHRAGDSGRQVAVIAALPRP
ncbi:MAG: polyphenol oxidase family protein [Gemmatimonadetes bacterium]|nr:polyphenol oxidase family protein [Gemmatimonadota bacterium]MBI3567452.1 polyphenol oxidase family protein [Gemmatimonadota bacterium]